MRAAALVAESELLEDGDAMSSACQGQSGAGAVDSSPDDGNVHRVAPVMSQADPMAGITFSP